MIGNGYWQIHEGRWRPEFAGELATLAQLEYPNEGPAWLLSTVSVTRARLRSPTPTRPPHGGLVRSADPGPRSRPLP